MYSTATASTVWTPADFGQARMAALGWLVEPGPRSRASRGEDAFLAEFRAAKEKVPHDPRALWDWYYLTCVLGDNTGDLRRRPATSAAPPPPTRWRSGPTSRRWASRQYGQGPRYYVAPGTEAERRHAPPARRRARPRPGLLPRPPAAPARAGRAADPRSRRRRAEAGQAGRRRRALLSRGRRRRRAGRRRSPRVFSLAAERGDVDGLIALLDRYERLQAGRDRRPPSAAVLLRGPGLLDVAGHERPGRGQGLRRRPPPARPLPRRRPPQARAGRPRARPREQLRQSLRRGQHAELSDLGRHAPRSTSAINFPLPNEYYDTARSRCCGRPTSSTSATT